ncbi:hypothetical protein [Lactobacillus delbrueckii]|uniref:hypothetical protein n=1 Tax=Lactobacillus delbrueckii TaxID=1584 RepID=UPI0038540D5B
MIILATYLFLDGTRTLMMNRILPSNEALVNFASLCLAITLNILSYTTLMFIACKIELPLAEDKRQNRIVLGLPIAISIFDIVCALFAPNLIFSANDINAFTPFFSTLFLLLPIGYSTFVFGVTAYNALINRKNGLGHYYLVLSFYPVLMTVFGFIERHVQAAGHRDFMRGDREPEPVRLPQGDRLPVPAGLPLRGFHAAG